MHSAVRQLIACATSAAAILAAACTTSTTSVVAPTGDKCQVSVATSASSFTATGGSGTVAVTTARDCTWSLSADASWIAVSGPTSGQGEASVPYSVQANPTPAARSGAIVVGSDRVTIAQAGAPCRFDLSQPHDTIRAAGGRLSVGLSTLTGCAWTASSGASWIGIVSGQNGTAAGTVVLNVAANAADARVGQVNIAGQNYTVSQDGAAPAPPVPTPTPPPPPTPDPPPPGPNPGPTVQFSGTISALTGVCPSITFVARNLVVLADASTEYKHGRCDGLPEGYDITITGNVQRDGTVHATALDLKKDGK